MEIVAGASAFDHVAGEGEGGAAKSDDWELSGKMFRDKTHSLGDVAEVSGAIGAELGYVFAGADGLLDYGAFSG